MVPTSPHPTILARFLRLFFQLLYNEFAFCYDLVAGIVSIGRWDRWVRSILPYIHTGKILELGYGPGHLQKSLANYRCMAFGLDASRQMGRFAYQRIHKISGVSRIVNGYAQFLPFQNSSFDQIISTFPAPYIFDPATVGEIFRVLRPGGQLVILLAAVITGRSIPDRVASGLFRLTGQSQPATGQYKFPIDTALFSARSEWVDLGNSRVLFIIASRNDLTKAA